MYSPTPVAIVTGGGTGIGAAIARHLAEAQWHVAITASVLNISSQGAFTGLGSSIAYAASKAALNNLTLALARSLAPKIRVNGLCPGFVDTQWTKGSMDECTYARFKTRIQNMTPLQRMATADEVAESALYLIANAGPITGQLLVIDGGNHLTVNAPDFDQR